MRQIGVLLLASGVLTSISIAVSADDKPKADAKDGDKIVLFDGKSLKNWKSADFYKPGEVSIKDQSIRLASGSPMTGVTWKGEKLPTCNYEVSWEAKREAGNDFFCALTFPVNDSPCSFVLAGWSGNITGLSSINGSDASENETQRYVKVENDKWYKCRLRVDDKRVSVWVNDEQIIDFEYADASLTVRIEVEANRPLGFASYRSVGLIRNVVLKKLKTK